MQGGTRSEKRVVRRTVMSICHLVQDEPANLDYEQLGTLYSQLGAVGADEVLRRAMEELALRLSHLDRQYRQDELEDLRKGTRTLVAIAEQIGLTKLANVARDVAKAIDQGDSTAIAATLSRLMRIGEKSLLAVWELQDMTICPTVAAGTEPARVPGYSFPKARSCL